MATIEGEKCPAFNFLTAHCLRLHFILPYMSMWTHRTQNRKCKKERMWIETLHLVWLMLKDRYVVEHSLKIVWTSVCWHRSLWLLHSSATTQVTPFKGCIIFACCVCGRSLVQRGRAHMPTSWCVYVAYCMWHVTGLVQWLSDFPWWDGQVSMPSGWLITHRQPHSTVSVCLWSVCVRYKYVTFRWILHTSHFIWDSLHTQWM